MTKSFKMFGSPPPNRVPKALLKSTAMWLATSIPTSSTNVEQPTGNPNFSVSLSSDTTSTPSCKKKINLIIFNFP